MVSGRETVDYTGVYWKCSLHALGRPLYALVVNGREMAPCIRDQCGKDGFFYWWSVGGRLSFTLVASKREMAVFIGGQCEEVSSLQGKYVGGKH